MSCLEELLPEFRKGAKIRCDYWDKGQFIQLKEDGYIYDDKDDRIEVSTLTLFGKSWELYQDTIDWEYVIKNRCLCWFFNSLGKAKYLNYLQAKEEHTFRDELGSCWDKCRPVCRDEVTFYEDRKDDENINRF